MRKTRLLVERRLAGGCQVSVKNALSIYRYAVELTTSTERLQQVKALSRNSVKLVVRRLADQCQHNVKNAIEHIPLCNRIDCFRRTLQQVEVLSRYYVKLVVRRLTDQYQHNVKNAIEHIPLCSRIDCFRRATLVGQGPRPKTVKLAGAGAKAINSITKRAHCRNS